MRGVGFYALYEGLRCRDEPVVRPPTQNRASSLPSNTGIGGGHWQPPHEPPRIWKPRQPGDPIRGAPQLDLPPPASETDPELATQRLHQLLSDHSTIDGEWADIPDGDSAVAFAKYHLDNRSTIAQLQASPEISKNLETVLQRFLAIDCEVTPSFFSDWVGHFGLKLSTLLPFATSEEGFEPIVEQMRDLIPGLQAAIHVDGVRRRLTADNAPLEPALDALLMVTANPQLSHQSLEIASLNQQACLEWGIGVDLQLHVGGDLEVPLSPEWRKYFNDSLVNAMREFMRNGLTYPQAIETTARIFAAADHFASLSSIDPQDAFITGWSRAIRSRNWTVLEKLGKEILSFFRLEDTFNRMFAILQVVQEGETFMSEQILIKVSRAVRERDSDALFDLYKEDELSISTFRESRFAKLAFNRHALFDELDRRVAAGGDLFETFKQLTGAEKASYELVTSQTPNERLLERLRMITASSSG